jgi:hypothetical protein
MIYYNYLSLNNMKILFFNNYTKYTILGIGIDIVIVRFMKWMSI